MKLPQYIAPFLICDMHRVLSGFLGNITSTHYLKYLIKLFEFRVAFFENSRNGLWNGGLTTWFGNNKKTFMYDNEDVRYKAEIL